MPTSKTQQINACIRESVHQILSDSPQASIWLHWMETDDFGTRSDHWDSLARSVGKFCARNDWKTLPNHTALHDFLILLQKHSGNLMRDFRESLFLSEAFRAGMQVNPSAAAFDWLDSIEAWRTQNCATLKASGKRPTNHQKNKLYPCMTLPAGALPQDIQMATDWVAGHPHRASLLLRNLTSPFLFSKKEAPARQTLQIIQSLLPQAYLTDAQALLAKLCQHTNSYAFNTHIPARLFFESCAQSCLDHQASFLVGTPDKTPLQSALECANEEVLRCAQKSLGTEFDSALHAAFSANIQASFGRSRTAPSEAVFGRQALVCARFSGHACHTLALQAASMLVLSNDEAHANLIEQICSTLKQTAPLSPPPQAWELPGFSPRSSDPQSVWESASIRPVLPITWLSSVLTHTGNRSYDFSSGSYKALLDGLMSLCIPFPWEHFTPFNKAPKGLNERLEAWQLNEAMRLSPSPIAPPPVMRL